LQATQGFCLGLMQVDPSQNILVIIQDTLLCNECRSKATHPLEDGKMVSCPFDLDIHVVGFEDVLFCDMSTKFLQIHG
jgi:hypothetical protein